MRYYISDLHFWHTAMNDRMDCRGFKSVEELNEYMINQWNSRVHRNDEVVILGDFCFANEEEAMKILKQLKGRKYLVIGNHDDRFLNKKDFDKSLFVKISNYLELNDDRRKVICSHYPIFCYNKQPHCFQDGTPISYMLHGHIHNTDDQDLVDEFVKLSREKERNGCRTSHFPCNVINCFCMYSDYIPQTLNEWIKINEERMKLGTEEYLKRLREKKNEIHEERVDSTEETIW